MLSEDAAAMPRTDADADGSAEEMAVRDEVMGPAYAKWVFGPSDTDQVIKGPAGEFARLAVRRMKRKDAKNVKASGDVAEIALEVVRAYLPKRTAGAGDSRHREMIDAMEGEKINS